MPNAKASHRWRPRFSLRTLTVIVALAASAFAHLGARIQRLRTQADCVQRIQELGGLVKYERTRPFQTSRFLSFAGVQDPGDVVSIDFHVEGFDEFLQLPKVRKHRRPVVDADIEMVSRLSDLRVLDVSHNQITDKGLRHLDKLTNLKSLDLTSTEITDSGIIGLASARQLEELRLSGTEITDSCAKSLSHLPSLRVLALGRTFTNLVGAPKRNRRTVSETRFTNAGIADLANCRAMEELDLRGLPLSREGLSQLLRINTLRDVNLIETEVSDATLKELAAMPSLRVIRLVEEIPTLVRRKGSAELTPSFVSRATVRQLQDARPDLQIVFP